MRDGNPEVVALMPALNEERSLPLALAAVPRDVVDGVIVIDNGSTDRTAEVARSWGAVVVSEPRRGYGSAMLRGLREVDEHWPTVHILAFLDADFSDDPTRLRELLAPIRDGRADFVLGSRALGDREPGALPLQSWLGNLLACFLIRSLTGRRYTDLGPFRAIRRDALERLDMRDRDFGWTVEMQLKAAIANVPTIEIPTPYRRRVGVSKISGTVKGCVLAGVKILATIARYGWRRPNPSFVDLAPSNDVRQLSPRRAS